MYKDKDKQREAQRERTRRYRDKHNVTPVTVTPEIIVKSLVTPQPERTEHGFIRVSKPGDADYVPQCETTRAFVEDGSMPIDTLAKMDAGCGDKLTHGLKRGKDITTFADLPPDVQATINRISQSNEEKAKRTKVAIQYQRLFPNRYHSTGWAGNVPIGQAQTAELGEARG